MSVSGALPPISRSKSFSVEICRRRHSRNSSRRKKPKDIAEVSQRYEKITELVREDVYLMDTKARRISTNLLANSLTARLRKNLPNGVAETDAIKKIRRDSLKDFAHLDNLERQFTSELQLESSRLDKESFQILKRQKHLQRQSEIERRKQERLESSLRSRSGLSSASLLPLSIEDGISSIEPQKETYPEFASVDKDDQSHVKVFKLKGIYQPTNKYSSRIEPLEISPRDKTTPRENNIQESLRLADNDSPADLPAKSRMSKMSKKGLRVSWSRQSRFYPDGSSEIDSVMSPSRAETRASQADIRSDASVPDVENNVKKYFSKRSFNSRLSMRSDTFLIQKQQKARSRSKVETIGLKWKVPPGVEAHPVIAEAPSRVTTRPNQRVSHNLMPVTTALDKEGMTTRKTCWHVQKAQQPLSKMDMYNAWVQKLELLKTKVTFDRVRHIPSRTTVMTQPV